MAKLGFAAVLLAVLARIAVPAGFMPGDTTHGWFLTLCPDGLTPTAMAALTGGSPDHHHDHHPSAIPDYGTDCLLSGLAMAALPVAGLELPDPGATLDPIVTWPNAPAAGSRHAVYRPRAPPPA